MQNAHKTLGWQDKAPVNHLHNIEVGRKIKAYKEVLDVPVHG